MLRRSLPIPMPGQYKRRRGYEFGKIYRIVCTKTGQEYVGATTYEHLKHRIDQHVYNYRAWQKAPTDRSLHLCSSIEVMKRDAYEYHLIENWPCANKKELTAREGFHVRRLKETNGDLCVNQCIPGRTRKEYLQSDQSKSVQKRSRLKHRDKRLQDNRDYHASHKEKAHANTKAYRAKNADRISSYKKSVRAWHKSCDFLSKINII
jgi:hypothetical protein